MNNLQLEQKIEAILLFKNEPVSLATLSKTLNVSQEDLRLTVSNLQKNYESRGIVIVSDGESICFGTNPNLSELIESMQKEEISKDIGRAGLETLSIILYKGPVSRREIDHIRGVNSGFILRNLLIRGLIERTEGSERSYSYKPTLELLKHLGLTKIEELPEYSTALRKIEDFVRSEPADTND
jgi:Predicted transcriptional regulator containing the HTH domain